MTHFLRSLSLVLCLSLWAFAPSVAQTSPFAGGTLVPIGGAGPGVAASRVAVGLSGSTVVSGVNTVHQLDGGVWTRLGGTFDGEIRALAVSPSGAIVAAGEFPSIGGRAASQAVQWDGAEWRDVAAGLDSDMTLARLAFGPDGVLFASGYVYDPSGSPRYAVRVVRQTGDAWTQLGDDFPSSGQLGSGPALAFGPGGLLYGVDVR